MLRLTLPLILFCSAILAHAHETRPNVLVIFIDDLGLMDIGIHGSTFYETPNIDALARSGVRFSNSYSANPVCSPTRAALMSGKAPQRIDITQYIYQGAGTHLGLEEYTIAEAFQEAGYRTGYIGKWHLGHADEYKPQAQGFDWMRCVNRAGQPASYYFPFQKPPNKKGVIPATNIPDLDGMEEDTYLTDALTDIGMGFIGEHTEQYPDQPFFLCLSHYAVHTPIEPPKNLMAKYEAKRTTVFGDTAPKATSERTATCILEQGCVGYAAMMENLDTNVGRMIEDLKKRGLYENTIIVFTSDNGGLSCTYKKNREIPTSCAPLRGGKGWTYEGGIRIPTFFSYPGHITANQVSDEPIITMDMYPTLLDLAGLELRPEQHCDGVSLKDNLLKGDSINRPQGFLAWTYPHGHSSGHRPTSAIRQGDWKLIICHEEDDKLELYNLSKDIGEAHNLADQAPERAARMEEQLRRWIVESTPERRLRTKDGRKYGDKRKNKSGASPVK